MRLAALADIHGNAEALRAVLADLDARGGADRLVVLGDAVLLGPDPRETVALLLERDAIGVAGNTDQFLLGTDWCACEPRSEEERADRALCLWALDRLDERAERWLRALPFQRELELGDMRLLLVHGSPRSDRDVIKADTPADDVGEMIAGAQPDVILFGHTHEPLDRTVRGKRLINPGAVGYPQGEVGTARYALLTCERGLHVEARLVHYDVEAAIERLLAARRPYRHWVAEMLRRTAHVPLTTFE
ncbi:MAG: metallophosphoesterase family protein [Anaerolineae bacterium]